MANQRKRAAGKSSVRTPTKRKGHPQTNPNSLANLMPPFPKGVSGNPGGRPGATIMSAAYKEWLATVNESDPQKRTNAQIGASAIGLEMMKGDVQAAKELRVATEGETLNLNGYTDDQLREFVAQRLARLGIPIGTGGETKADSDRPPERADSTPG